MAFATAAELATRLGVTFTAGQTTQATAILADATAYLQAEIGQTVEGGTTTFTVYVDPRETRIRLPQWPVRSVTTVTLNGVAITDHELRDGHLSRISGWPPASLSEFATVTIVYVHGLVTVPLTLTMWCCILSAGVIAQINRSASFGSAGVASERIDDYAVNYEPGSVAMELPERVLDNLRSQFGAGAYVTSSR